MPGGAIHDLVSGSYPSVRMTAGIICPAVGLNFNDPAGDYAVATVPIDGPSQEILGYQPRVARKEPSGEPLQLFARNLVSLGSGQEFMTSDLVSQPLCAMPTPSLMRLKRDGPWESVLIANRHPMSRASRM